MLKDRIVAITGAAGGLGPSVARAFFEKGAVLALAGRTEAKLAALLDTLGVPREKRMSTGVDLSDETATQEWADLVTTKLGLVDVVIHLVGGYTGGTSISEIAAADWDSLQAMLVKSTLNVVRAFARPLAAGGWGRFLAVTSPKAQAPTARSALYAAAKSASDALVLALADELRGTGATANLVVIDSLAEEGGAGRPAPDASGAAPKKPYGKTTPAAQIAAAMLFLCSDEAATINGARLPLMGHG